MSTIYHITHLDAWEEAQRKGFYEGNTLFTEGFIHCSTAAQVVPVADRFYLGQRGLVLIEINPARLHAELRYEESEPGQLFPHIYGPLNIEAVSAVFAFRPNAEGRFNLPTGVVVFA